MPESFDEMGEEQLAAIRARLAEPPPPIALAARNHGFTPLVEYLALLQEDRIALVDEVDRLRAEIVGEADGQSPATGASSAGAG